MYSARLSDLRKYRHVPDIVHEVTNKTTIAADSSENVEDSVAEETNEDSSLIRVDSIKERIKPILALKDTTLVTKDTTLAATDTTQSQATDSTDRFFEAYYHVRIYSDSLQAMGDSLFYSAQDSVFRLFDQPVVWTRESQVTGDTIYLYTENKKPKRMYVFENALTINKVGSLYYNQVKGRTTNAYFENGNIVYSRTKGNAESIYYAQDEENKFIGVNRATADIIDMYFENRKPQRVVFRSNLVGTSYPMRQVNHEELRLRGFQWLEDIRPKSENDLLTEPPQHTQKETPAKNDTENDNSNQ